MLTLLDDSLIRDILCWVISNAGRCAIIFSSIYIILILLL